MWAYDSKTGRSRAEKRRVRHDELSQPRELTFSCYRQLQLLSKDRTREWFCEALEAARKSCGIKLWAYKIMPEHVHLIADPGGTARNMSHFLQMLKEPVGRKAVDYLCTSAPTWLARLQVQEGKRTRHRFWQPGGGYDRNITSAAVLRSMIDYIHNNPVRRGLVSNPEDWEWSSARWYAGIRPVQIEMDASVLDELA